MRNPMKPVIRWTANIERLGIINTTDIKNSPKIMRGIIFGIVSVLASIIAATTKVIAAILNNGMGASNKESGRLNGNKG